MRQPPIFLGSSAQADLAEICNRLTLRAALPGLIATLRLILGRRGVYLGPDVVPLLDQPPWFRIDLRSYVVLARPMTQLELARHGSTAPTGFVVARIVQEAEILGAINDLLDDW